MMKSNIDLTENEMFSRPRRNKKISWLENRFPWDFKFTKTQPKACEIIFTGNRKARMLKKLYSRESMADHCDRCGTSLVKIPWDRTYGLCKHCSIEIEQQVVGNKLKCPWINKKKVQAEEINPLIW